MQTRLRLSDLTYHHDPGLSATSGKWREKESSSEACREDEVRKDMGGTWPALWRDHTLRHELVL